uniref:Uncharacterized protein n=1 Tax=Anguilla anguilla TaxID=7936 RepID=A0A0E9RNS3_ANGAN
MINNCFYRLNDFYIVRHISVAKISFDQNAKALICSSALVPTNFALKL